MTVSAYVHISVQTGKTKSTLNRMSRIQGIKSACSVMGPFDIIAVVQANDLSGIERIVTGKIQLLPGVKTTMTSLIV
ncbi:MAG: Lrp/AsnC ligand binding domain-containing protein [Candidatus Eisenbacteria bacterium]|nr:Lrp/AsnC ligand binding domain-containing protein [Candidatus Eisenbacteria bacterium]